MRILNCSHGAPEVDMYIDSSGIGDESIALQSSLHVHSVCVCVNPESPSSLMFPWMFPS